MAEADLYKRRSNRPRPEVVHFPRCRAAIRRETILSDYVAAIVQLTSTHSALAGPIVGALAFGESLAIVGLFIPAAALMFAVGGLIGTGAIDPAPVLLCGIFGAVLGDWVSYLIGRRIGPSVYRRWPLNRHRPAVARTRLFFRRYGFAAILFGRFLGPIRATVPIVAGVMNMKHRSFQLANAISAIIWVPALLAPAYLVVRRIGSVDAITDGHLAGLGIAAAITTLATGLICVRLLGLGRRNGRVAQS